MDGMDFVDRIGLEGLGRVKFYLMVGRLGGRIGCLYIWDCIRC
jgi:hypothetical protein